jgi:nucleoside-diphosphate-sugar epimerase
VLGQAAEAGIERVVMTSSTVAIMYPSGPRQSRLYDETDWTDPERADLTAYIVSKTLAERAAWQLAGDLGRKSWLTVINPGLVLGPALDRDLSASHELLRLMSAGKYPAAPAVGYPVVDVRDVAAAHVRALRAAGAGGERIIAAEGYLTLMNLARLMARECPHLKWRMPWFKMHDSMVRMMSRFDRRLWPVVPDLGVVRATRNDKAKRLLGMTFRSAEEAAVSAIRSLRQVGTIP